MEIKLMKEKNINSERSFYCLCCKKSFCSCCEGGLVCQSCGFGICEECYKKNKKNCDCSDDEKWYELEIDGKEISSASGTGLK